MLKFRSVLIYNFRRLAADNKGTTAIEYAVIASGIAAVIVASVALVGTNLLPFYERVAAAFN